MASKTSIDLIANVDLGAVSELSEPDTTPPPRERRSKKPIPKTKSLDRLGDMLSQEKQLAADEAAVAKAEAAAQKRAEDDALAAAKAEAEAKAKAAAEAKVLDTAMEAAALKDIEAAQKQAAAKEAEGNKKPTKKAGSNTRTGFQVATREPLKF